MELEVGTKIFNFRNSRGLSWSGIFPSNSQPIILFVYLFILLFSLLSVKDTAYGMLILSAIPYFIFPHTSLFPSENSSFSPLHNSFPVVSLCHPEYQISFCCPLSGDILVGNVLLLVFGFHMLVIS